jgi:hypothetical protein
MLGLLIERKLGGQRRDHMPARQVQLRSESLFEIESCPPDYLL